MEMPGIREAASAAFGSGNAPIWSADTTLTMFGAVRCWLRARAWPSAMGLAVTETDSEKFAGASFTSTTRVWPEVTVTSARSVLWPRYVTSSEYGPGGTAARRNEPARSVAASREVPSSAMSAPTSGAPLTASVTVPEMEPAP